MLLEQVIVFLHGVALISLVGILTALVAYLIMLSEVLLSSLKSGYCQTSFFTSQKACGIDGFKYWASETSSQFVIYLLFATAFATTASLLTMTTITKFPSGRTLYMAAGSGIPEVKTILGGFIIHGFLYEVQSDLIFMLIDSAVSGPSL